MSVREDKSEKKIPFSVQSGSTSVGQAKEQWLLQGRCLQGSHSTQRAPLLCRRAWAGLRTWFWLPRLLGAEHRVNNSVPGRQMTIQSAHWPVLTPQHQQNQTTATNGFHPKRLHTEGKLISLSKEEQLPYIHFRAWFHIHDCSRKWQFWLMLENCLCLLRNGPLRDAAFLVGEGWGDWCCLSLEALPQSPNRWISGKHLYLFAFTTKNMSLWLFCDHPDKELRWIFFAFEVI